MAALIFVQNWSKSKEQLQPQLQQRQKSKQKQTVWKPVKNGNNISKLVFL